VNYFCCDERRREEVKNSGTPLNGIDFLEVFDDPDRPPGQQSKTMLKIHFLKSDNVADLTPQLVRIEGGERIRNIVVRGVSVGSAEANVLTIRVDRAGDFSTYRLRLAKDPQSADRPDKFDPLLSAVDFSFRVEGRSDFDCRAERVCPPEPEAAPEIDYLAKDYGSFRRLMLDRLAHLIPGRNEQNPADIGVVLVEMLAHAGDLLSYRQDVVATEAYLGTARQRISVRRHARLVDYRMHDGCNARAWVQVQVSSDTGPLPKGTRLFTRIPGQPRRLPDDPQVLRQALAGFETMHRAARLFADHNTMQFYTWLDRNCCLPKGATRATLTGHLPNLLAGDVLVFKEVLGPLTGKTEDADLSRRCAVRLTHVVSAHVVSADGKPQPLTDPLKGDRITEIAWADDDALPFPLCISATTDKGHGEQDLGNTVSIACGNIVLADHGLTIGLTTKEAPIPDAVPQPAIIRPGVTGADRCAAREPEAVPPRYRPRLAKRPVTFAVPYRENLVFGIDFRAAQAAALDGKDLPDDLKTQFNTRGIDFRAPPSIQGIAPEWSISDGERAYRIREETEAAGARLNVYELAGPARGLLLQAPADALPEAILNSERNGETATWRPKRDLLNSARDATDFVVEVEADGTAYLRFGDDQLGKRPKSDAAAQTTFRATYRVANGVAGNVGAGSIVHIITDDENGSKIAAVTNPLPASGGVDPETMDEVRQRAPFAFRGQERAVTADDYARVAERHPGIQRAAATLRSTGSWLTVFLTIDRLGGAPVDDTFKAEMRAHMERFRMAGHDLEIEEPNYVSLEIEMRVSVAPDYFRSHVEAALRAVFSNRTLPDGRRGIFHPDNFTFGQPVYLSPLIAAAQALDGVALVQVTTFQRQGTLDLRPLAEGKLVMGRSEIARCDNDPNFPEHGVFRLKMEGGR
jgi:predicted phage baseplate assembly protein